VLIERSRSRTPSTSCLPPGPRSRAENYAALRTGEVGLVVDSYGLLSVAVDRGSAADTLGLHAGDPVTLEAFEGPLLTLRAVEANDDDRATDEAPDR